MKSEDSNNSNMPVKGANSFTMGEARSHIVAQGYTDVSALKKDSAGVWRGAAMKDGQRVHVSVDYQGNVNAD
jgi:cell envelope opacity-associated protein A